MRIEGVFSAGLGPGGVESGELERRFPPITPRLVGVAPGVYDRKIAEVLAFASTWTYSDVTTFASVMVRHGLLGCDAAALTLANDALLLNPSAIVVQSSDRNVVILSFRGTEPRNAINWLSDASTQMEPFASAGHVHGGFHRAVRAMWEPLKDLLTGLYVKKPLCEQLTALKDQWMSTCPNQAPPGATRAPCASGEGEHAGATGGVNATDAGRPPEVLSALYITGHSQGAALAVIAAALIESDNELAGLRAKVRGVYTFGQPMVGDRTFAEEHSDTIGRKLFRHVYGRDIVPRMPPFAVGRFQHLGRQYNSTDQGWVYEPRPVRQAITVGLSNVLGVAAWVSQQISPISWLRLPFSWGDHMPSNYIRTSMISTLGDEVD
ncbi:lipase family protein [Sorangium sp. So ce388]|uniref:lipase family protein n=1 Tax=Sorangium sp. So ce388 TaxID=3133309 RepID=UPI003F5C66BB